MMRGIVQEQRLWLRDQIATITAPVTIVASGSVLFGAPSQANEPPKYNGYCSGDDWDCYRPAQQNLIAELARIPGCVIVITGDYHAGDIKRIVPGEAAPYAAVYNPPVRRSLIPSAQHVCLLPRLALSCSLMLGQTGAGIR